MGDEEAKGGKTHGRYEELREMKRWGGDEKVKDERERERKREWKRG